MNVNRQFAPLSVFQRVISKVTKLGFGRPRTPSVAWLGRATTPEPLKKGLHPSAFAWLVLVALTSPSCSTPNVNPPSAHADTGYVDFYTDSDLELSWEVKWFDPRSAKLKTVFNQFQPVEGSVLRLASRPGRQRFQVWFINKVTEGPQAVEVDVENGKVTPVHVSLTQAGKTSVDRKSYVRRATVRGSRRAVNIATDEQGIYRIAAAAETPQAYQPKERMSYWSVMPK